MSYILVDISICHNTSSSSFIFSTAGEPDNDSFVWDLINNDRRIANAVFIYICLSLREIPGTDSIRYM